MDGAMSIGDEGLAAKVRAQRARGQIRAAFARAGARTEASNLYETGGLRMRFPRAGAGCEAVIVNTGGGMAGGDRASIGLCLGAGAEVRATTQSAEKIYRSDGAKVAADLAFEVGAGARLIWAPQETLLFDGAWFTRRLEADVAAQGSLLILEAAVFGRLAHGEIRSDAAFRDDWRVRRDGKLIFAEALRIENAGTQLDRTAIGRGARAVATMLFVDPGAPTRLEPLRAEFALAMEAPGEWLEAGASVIDGALIARALSPSPARLRAALVGALRVLDDRAPPRVWS